MYAGGLVLSGQPTLVVLALLGVVGLDVAVVVLGEALDCLLDLPGGRRNESNDISYG